jgi:putative ABC transport system permease protein
MSPIDLVTTAAANSVRSKLRTTLTVLAIFIGSFTLTVTSAIGTGVADYIDTQIGAFGAPDVLSISKAAENAEPREEGPRSYDPDSAVLSADFTQFDAEALTAEDLEAIAGVPGILDVSAVQQVSPRYVEYDGGGKYVLDVNAGASLTTPDLSAGDPLDNSGTTPQILLVTSYVEPLGFGSARDAVGETVEIGVADYSGEMHVVEAEVAGVQNATILASGAALNQALVDALHDIQTLGQPSSTEESSILATAHFDPSAGPEALAAVKDELGNLGYSALTVADQIGVIQTVISGITGVLNAFAVIALIAAGFGIINTLLMSVQERTREIGLMKAMGMSGARIYTLFSLEAVFIGVLGSILGAAAAIGVGVVANDYLATGLLADLEGLEVMRFEFVPVATVLLTVMAIAFLAGTLPARRAARQNPIEALRYE